MKKVHVFLRGWVTGCLVFVASPAAAQTRPTSAAVENQCSPACGEGTLCYRGQCVSACNPACDAGEACVAGECVEARASVPPARPVASPPAPAPAPASAPAPAPAPAVDPSPPDDHAAGTVDTTKRTTGWIVAAAGLVGLGVAVVEQVTALGRSDDSNKAAGDPDPAVQATAKPIHDQAVEAQTYAIVAGAVGGVALGAGLYLVLTSSGAKPSAASAPSWRVTPQVGARGGSFMLERTW